MVIALNTSHLRLSQNVNRGRRIGVSGDQFLVFGQVECRLLEILVDRLSKNKHFLLKMIESLPEYLGDKKRNTNN